MDILKKLIPHIVAILAFVIISFSFFAPAAFEGKVLRQHDNVQAQGLGAEIIKMHKEEGTAPLWTNAAFGGMPAYQIWGVSKNQVWSKVRKVMMLSKDMKSPHGLLLLAMLCCYIALLLFRIDYRIAAVSSIGFALMTNNIIYIDAGHTIKMIAIFMAMPILAGVYNILKGRTVLGFAVTGFFLAFQLSANHYQITYYTFLIVAIMSIAYLVKTIKSGFSYSKFKPLLIIVLAVIIGVLSNLGKFWSTYEYAQETIRGKTYLTSDQSGGLDKSYAQSYSFGIGESFGLMFPKFKGGSASNASFLGDKSSNTYKTFKKIRSQIPQNQMRSVQGLTRTYWGASGTLHYGSILCFLFILGLTLVGPMMRWTGIVGMVFFLMLSWGNNFSGFNDLMFDYFPMYNKFRDPKMCLQVGQILIVLIGALGLNKYFSKEISSKRRLKSLKISGGIFLGILTLLLAYSFVGDLSATNDVALASLAELQNAIQIDRASIMRSGLFRSMIFVGLTILILWLSYKNKISLWLGIGGIGVLLLADLWMIDTNHISKDSYYKKKDVFVPKMTAADQQILKDKEPNYRVLDMSRGNPFASATASNFHHSIGGYHAAKLRRFQDLVDNYILSNNQWTFNTNPQILDMLNVKYIISQNGQVSQRQQASGNAWFVNSVKSVSNADAEMKELASFNPLSVAIVQNQHDHKLTGINKSTNNASAGDQIKLDSYSPDLMSYSYNASKERLAVFSEIYYPASKGWHAYLNGERMSNNIFPVDYLLRGLVLPAGNNKLEMRFEPKSFLTGDWISMIVSWLLLFLMFWTIYSYSKSNNYTNVLPILIKKEDSELRKSKKKVLQKALKSKRTKRK